MPFRLVHRTIDVFWHPILRQPFARVNRKIIRSLLNIWYQFFIMKLKKYMRSCDQDFSEFLLKISEGIRSGGQNLERRNVERPIFRN